MTGWLSELMWFALAAVVIIIAVMIVVTATGGAEQALLRKLHIAAGDHGLVVGPHQRIENRVIGISECGTMLFFIRRTGDNFDKKELTLNQYKQVRLALSGSARESGRKPGTAHDIVMEFFPRFSNRGAETVLFYDAEKDDPSGQKDYELAARWVNRLSDLVTA